MLRRAAWSLAAAGALLLGACAGDADNGDGGAAPPDVDGDATVSVWEHSSLGPILIDPSGATLYQSEQEQDGTVRCLQSCEAMWPPVLVDDGETPTAGDGIAGEVGTVERPDGGTQVTLDGTPLYTFSLDSEPGEVSGNGLSDTFDGTEFTWRVVTPSGATPSTDPPDFRY